jgi:hypothetical protein
MKAVMQRLEEVQEKKAAISDLFLLHQASTVLVENTDKFSGATATWVLQK